MVEGEVVFFHDKGGYGFIDSGEEQDEEDDDIFFHMSDVEGPDLEEGEAVTFEVEEAEEGPRAVEIERVDEEETEEE